MANEIVEELQREITKNLSVILASFFVVIIVLFLFYLRNNYIISIIACGFIVMLSLEKRGNNIDKYLAMFVILVLTVGFMFL